MIDISIVKECFFPLQLACNVWGDFFGTMRMSISPLINLMALAPIDNQVSFLYLK